MRRSALISASLALAIVATPVMAFAQSPAAATAAAPAAITPADAKAFLGDWTITGQSEMGPFVVALSVKTDAESVIGNISSDVQPPTSITDVTRDGEGLVLRYSFDFDGNAIPAVLTLTPKADKLDAWFSFGDGAFEMAGTGSKAAQQ